MKKILIFVFACIIFVSCMSKKDRYVKSYEAFVNKVIEQCDSYTSTDWDACIQNYEEFRNDYSKYMPDMTLADREKINTLNSKINAKLIEKGAENTIKEFENSVNEIIGTLDELLN